MASALLGSRDKAFSKIGIASSKENAISIFGMAFSKDFALSIFGMAFSRKVGVSMFGIAFAKKINYKLDEKYFISMLGISPSDIRLLWISVQMMKCITNDFITGFFIGKKEEK